MICYKDEDLSAVLKFIGDNDVIAFDTETTGLNTRSDRVIGFGVSNGQSGFYIPLLRWDMSSSDLVPTTLNCIPILEALKTKKLLMFNSSFDARMTLNNFGIDLLPALHADVLLMKHSSDEEYPFALKDIGKKIFGSDATKEKEEVEKSIKDNGGKAKQFYKADTEILGRYCEKDCLLTYRLWEHYEASCSAQGLTDFYYRDEVLPLYKQVTIPMESAGVQLDMPLLKSAYAEIVQDLETLEAQFQGAIEPHLALFTTWFLNKDYPLKTFTGKTPAWSKKHESQYAAWRSDNPTAYMFNSSSKHHLKKLYFDTLKCEPLSRTPTGLPQVDDEFLSSISHTHNFTLYLQDINKLTKIKGTYIERFLEEAEGGRFYPSYKQHGTVSGRLSGDFQQLPRPISDDDVLRGKATAIVQRHTNKIRRFIIPDAGCTLISADYAQLEPRCFAHASGDEALKAIFRGGLDFYSTIAKRTEGLETVSKEQRQKAKAYALGIAYGMTGYKLKFEIDVDQETADRLVSDYLHAFPDLSSWMEESKQAAYIDGTVQSQAGRIRHLGKAKYLYAKYGSAILDDLQLWKQFNTNPGLYTQAKADRREFKNLCNNAINFQIQSLGASIINRAAIQIARRFKAEGMKTKIVGQVHDELIFNVPNNEVPVAKIIIQTCMEQGYKLDVPLIANPISGQCYADCK